MKKVIPIAIALTIAGSCCVVAAYFCHFYYTLYQNTATGLESRINGFDMRLGRLEAHKTRELTPIRLWGQISSTDRPADEYMATYWTTQKKSVFPFEVVSGKDTRIIPEFRLPAGSTNDYAFDIWFGDRLGAIADAWLSHVQPYSDLAAFEQFHVFCPNGTNVLRLLVRAKPNASVQMRFDIVVLCER